MEDAMMRLIVLGLLLAACSAAKKAHLSYEGIDVDTAMLQICRSFVRSLSSLWLDRRS